jgi:hypothetical protein
LLYTDATNSRVGVGTISPAEKLDVVGNIKLSGNVIPASGFGIDFSATSHPAGMTSELLADYEEGDWTATLIGTTTAPTTPVTVTARYTKIGRQVTIELTFLNVDTTGASGNLRVTGLPYAAGSANGLGVCAVCSAILSAFPAFQLGAGGTTMDMIQITTGNNIAIPSSIGVFIFSTLTYSV